MVLRRGKCVESVREGLVVTCRGLQVRKTAAATTKYGVVLKVNAPGHKTRYNGKVHDYRDKAPTTSWGSMDHRIRVGAIAVLALGDGEYDGESPGVVSSG